MNLQRLFPAGRFAPAANEAQIAAVESDLGFHLPEQLRRLYLQCDGFRENRGNAKYLLSLTDEDYVGSLLSITRFWWEKSTSEPYPNLDFRPYIFFGMSGADDFWGINRRTSDEIIAYHHQMEGRYEVVGSDIIEVYRRDYATYDELHCTG